MLPPLAHLQEAVVCGGRSEAEPVSLQAGLGVSLAVQPAQSPELGPSGDCLCQILWHRAEYLNTGRQHLPAEQPQAERQLQHQPLS